MFSWLTSRRNRRGGDGLVEADWLDSGNGLVLLMGVPLFPWGWHGQRAARNSVCAAVKESPEVGSRSARRSSIGGKSQSQGPVRLRRKGALSNLNSMQLAMALVELCIFSVCSYTHDKTAVSSVPR